MPRDWLISNKTERKMCRLKNAYSYNLLKYYYYYYYKTYWERIFKIFKSCDLFIQSRKNIFIDAKFYNLIKKELTFAVLQRLES